MASMKVTNLTDRIFHVEMPYKHLLAMTFLRFQEYHESPKFHGKVFTLEEYMEWYAIEGRKRPGHFTYDKDWHGFNIPSRVLKPFCKGKFDPLTNKERALLKIFEDRHGKFSIMGTAEDDKHHDDTLEHEFCHGLLYTIGKYRRMVLAKLRESDDGEVRELLLEWGYLENVLDDEVQAYAIVKPEYIMKHLHNTSNFEELSKQLRAIYRETLLNLYKHRLPPFIHGA